VVHQNITLAKNVEKVHRFIVGDERRLGDAVPLRPSQIRTVERGDTQE